MSVRLAVEDLTTSSLAAHWEDLALCRGVDPELFFPARGESTKEAKAICARCPVRVACLEQALATNEKFGIFGGTSERERRRLRKARRHGLSIVKEETMTIVTDELVDIDQADDDRQPAPDPGTRAAHYAEIGQEPYEPKASHSKSEPPIPSRVTPSYATRTCATCGALFTPGGPSQKYCSKPCRPSKALATTTTTTATCRTCGKAFESRSGARYCSRRCTVQADEQRRATHQVPEPVAAPDPPPAPVPAIAEDRDPPWLTAFLTLLRGGDILEVTVVTSTVTHTMKATDR